MRVTRGALGRPRRRPRDRAGAVLLGLALALSGGLAGCGEDTPERARAASASGSEPTAEPGHGPSAPAVAPPPATVRRVEGTVTIGGAAAIAGAEVVAERPIVVPEGGRAVLQLRDGGRVELDGPARARVVDEGGAQILLVRGALHAVQPPMGSSPRPPLRIVSPGATVEIGAAGEIYLATFDGGSSWVTTLGGAAAVENGEADVRRRLRTVDLVAGQAVAVTNRIAEPTEGPSRLSAAREAARVLAGGEGEGDDPGSRQRREVEHEADRLDQALRWLETEARRGRELTTQHRTAVREGNEEESQRIQRQLVEHSQTLYRLRRLATARWERLRVRQLRLIADGRGSAEDPVAARRDRVAGLLGL